MNLNREFWRSKKVLITGNTGFKGIWLTKLLLHLNAEVIGYSINDNGSFFEKKKLLTIINLNRFMVM